MFQLQGNYLTSIKETGDIFDAIKKDAVAKGTIEMLHSENKIMFKKEFIDRLFVLGRAKTIRLKDMGDLCDLSKSSAFLESIMNATDQDTLIAKRKTFREYIDACAKYLGKGSETDLVVNNIMTWLLARYNVNSNIGQNINKIVVDIKYVPRTVAVAQETEIALRNEKNVETILDTKTPIRVDNRNYGAQVTITNSVTAEVVNSLVNMEIAMKEIAAQNNVPTNSTLKFVNIGDVW